jgi:hypothetical protein
VAVRPAQPVVAGGAARSGVRGQPGAPSVVEAPAPSGGHALGRL